MSYPTDRQDRFNYFADAFILQSGDWEELRKICDVNLQSARDILAFGETTDSTPEQRAAECLREVMKPIQQWLYNLNMMHDAIGMPLPFPSVRIR